MPNLLFEKCKNCGAPLNASRALNGVLECEYCGSAFTLPKEETAGGVIEQLKIAANAKPTSAWRFPSFGCST